MDEHELTPKAQTDIEGRPVPPDEPPDKEILVWIIDPALDSYGAQADYIVERSYQDMLNYVSNNLELALEQRTFEELQEEPFVLKIRVAKMRVSDWQEITDLP